MFADFAGKSIAPRTLDPPITDQVTVWRNVDSPSAENQFPFWRLIVMDTPKKNSWKDREETPARTQA